MRIAASIRLDERTDTRVATIVRVRVAILGWMSEPRLRRLPTNALTASEIDDIRSLMDVAFGSDEDDRFTDEDWAHAIGGTHFVLDLEGRIVAHASVVERQIQVAGRPLRTGYVEAVATAPEHQGIGLGSLLMTAVTAEVRDRYELGVLGTGRHHFYERLGWMRWLGPSSVRLDGGERATPEDDGYIMVLATPASPPLDPHDPITCEWRPGDVW
jgi:aminoglycoside 2'-N-acetyltransferase I